MNAVCATITRALSQRQGPDTTELSDNYEYAREASLISGDEYEEGEEDDELLWSLDSPKPEQQTLAPKSKISTTAAATTRFRLDMWNAKEAGFKVGVLGDLNAGGFICVSIRVVKLGISEEAMKAWRLRRRHYLVLLIRFEAGYKTLEEVCEDASRGRGKTEMHVTLSEQYKPSVTDAINVFNQPVMREPNGDSTFPEAQTQAQSTMEALFIGRPLSDLLRDRFAGIVKYRFACGFSWTGSERFFNDTQGKSLGSADPFTKRYTVDDDADKRALPAIVMADQIASSPAGRHLSYPLVAMQFVLRHFVRCTEFCLVCHCKTEVNFEALKPYVCSGPLCLFQYLNLGFGPSIEWEILSQPYVVDLLVSFCYAGARGGRLREYPLGIDLQIPHAAQVDQTTGQTFYPPTHKDSKMAMSPPAVPSIAPIVARFDPRTMEIIFPNRMQSCPLKCGDWVKLECTSLDERHHAKVKEIAFWPVVNLEGGMKIAEVPSSLSGGPGALGTTRPIASQTAAIHGPVECRIYIYNQPFDDLSIEQKNQSICEILDTLPSVGDMKQYLEARRPARDPTLSSWRERISPAALNLLRWIIASNRSCILQASNMKPSPAIDPVRKSKAAEQAFSRVALGSSEDHVSGMAGWVQFRFAQGAPDKEQRFIDCVTEVSARTKKNFPTIFAWHGSSLVNWHSIVRAGLDYNDTLNGRSYGNGVYMSPQYSVSIGYSGVYHNSAYPSGAAMWPQSNLKISAALSLNEVVNAPEEYLCRTPHYVVGNIDWIQTRYLFVKCSGQMPDANLKSDEKPEFVYEQDPQAQAIGENGYPVVIPITAVSKSRRPVASPIGTFTSISKKAKKLRITNQEKVEMMENDDASISTESADNEILFSSDDDEPMPLVQPPTSPVNKLKRPMREECKTDFIPGALGVAKLRLINPPSNASVMTTRTLLKALQATLQVQESTPLHELGWYVHGDDVENMYQWIAELHSFDPVLPLAKDMKKAGLRSIVLELRFTNQFPFSPPFVRVIQPRFLPFAHGGGGHVTVGGALCMELLTNSGWSAATSIENVLVQVRMAISSTDPKPARLEDGNGLQPYGVHEAVSAYKRACMMHGWSIPKDFENFPQQTAGQAG